MDAWRHFHGSRYELFALCVMPDHVHALFQPWPKEGGGEEASVFWSMTELMRSLKSFTARQINVLEAKQGSVWEKETFDRYIRSDQDLAEKFSYIMSNPWTSGIVQAGQDYRWLWTAEDELRTAESSSRQNAAVQLGALQLLADRAGFGEAMHQPGEPP